MLYNSLGSRLIAVGFILFTTGCASLPASQPIVTGEPLSVQEETKTYTYTAKEKVGSVDHRDSHGRRTGTSTVYADKKKVGSYTVWSSYQGDTKISDDDLFAIAKDEEASREVKSSRQNGVLMERLGIGVTVLSILAVGAGLYLNTKQQDGVNSNLPLGLMLGGGVGFGIGSSMMYSGSGKVSAKHPLEQSRAESAAERYNQSLPSSKSGAVGLK